MIPVGGRAVRVRYVEALPRGDRGAAGENEITVSKSACTSGRMVFETIYHELQHVAFRQTGHSLAMTEDAEEALVYALEHSLAPLFVFSPAAGIKYRDVSFPWEEDAV